MKPSRSTCVVAFAAALSLTHASVAGAFTPSAADRAENTPLDLGPATTSKHASTSSAAGGSIVRTLVGLVIVVALIYAVTWVLRRIKQKDGGKAVGSGLQSVASLPLAPGRSLALVRAGSDFVLVGVAEQQITPIRRYTEEEARVAGLLDDDDGLVGDPVPVRVDTLSHEGARRLSASFGGDPPRVEPSVAGVLEALRRWTVRS